MRRMASGLLRRADGGRRRVMLRRLGGLGGGGTHVRRDRPSKEYHAEDDEQDELDAGDA